MSTSSGKGAVYDEIMKRRNAPPPKHTQDAVRGHSGGRRRGPRRGRGVTSRATAARLRERPLVPRLEVALQHRLRPAELALQPFDLRLELAVDRLLRAQLRRQLVELVRQLLLVPDAAAADLLCQQGPPSPSRRAFPADGAGPPPARRAWRREARSAPVDWRLNATRNGSSPRERTR